MASNPTVDSFTADIQALRQELRALKDDLSGLSGSMGGGSMMPSSLGNVSTNSFGRFDMSNPMSGLLAKTGLSSILSKGVASKSMGVLAGGTAGLLASTGVLTSLMPSMDKYAVRESGYYMAGMYSMGSTTRDSLKTATLGRLSELGGLTSVGADATVAAILSGRGVNTSSPYYNTMINQIGNVGRYMNMDNEVAAQSMANLTGGRTSASLLQRGIFTSNPLTGKSLKESDIFEQIANRFIVGDMSVEDTQDEIRRGFLGANIESLDIDAAAKERLKMYLIARAGGEKVDFSDSESMARAFGDNGALQKAGFTNPLEQVYRINAAETGGIESFTKSYNEGLKEGADALADLYTTVSKVTSGFGQLNAFLSTLLGNDLGANIGNPVSAAALGLVNVFGNPEKFTEDFKGFLGQISASMLTPFASLIPGLDSTGGGGNWDDSNIGAFTLPVPAGSQISSGYDAPRLGTDGNPLPGTDGSHDGIDYKLTEGTEVRAAYDGTVSGVRLSDSGGGYGIYVKLDHGDGWETLYGHLQSVDPRADRVGKTVRRGEVIGKSGNTGNSSGPHLHFETRKNGQEAHPSTFTGATGSGVGGAGSSGGGFMPPIGAAAGSSSQSLLASLAIGGGSSGSGVSYGGTSVVGSRGGNSVTINLSVASASEAEAVRFAEIVKQKLEEDSFMDQMGAK